MLLGSWSLQQFCNIKFLCPCNIWCSIPPKKEHSYRKHCQQCSISIKIRRVVRPENEEFNKINSYLILYRTDVFNNWCATQKRQKNDKYKTRNLPKNWARDLPIEKLSTLTIPGKNERVFFSVKEDIEIKKDFLWYSFDIDLFAVTFRSSLLSEVPSYH